MSSGKIEQNDFKFVENNLIFNELDAFTQKYLHKSHYFQSKPCNQREFDYNFNMIQKIHLILKNSQDLTLEEKFDYCSNQRFFMKQCLKEISKKFSHF
jgi:hypothetical protein